jgi:hypothetical protein
MLIDMILKRTLTRKSILGFGYSDVRDLSVQMILDLKKEYILINAYFNLGKINFTDDILNELGISEKWRIDKPGKNVEKGNEFNHYRMDQMTDEERIKYFAMARKNVKFRNIRSKSSQTTFRSDNLRAKNHGNYSK